MGHLSLSRLPTSLRWREVLRLLNETPEDIAGITSSTLYASETYFRSLADDPSLAYCYWALARVALSAVKPGLPLESTGLGLPAASDQPLPVFMGHLADTVRRELQHYPESGHASSLASLALRQTLTGILTSAGHNPLNATVRDLQDVLARSMSGQTRGQLVGQYFANFVSRTIQSFLDRELCNYVGYSHALSSIQQSQGFLEAIDAHVHNAARVVEHIAQDWPTDAQGVMQTPNDARGFVASALKRLRTELIRGSR